MFRIMETILKQQQDVATARQGQGWPFGVAAKIVSIVLNLRLITR